MLLAGNSGGTTTDLATFIPKDELCQPLNQVRFANTNYSSFAAMIGKFLTKTELPVTA